MIISVKLIVQKFLLKGKFLTYCPALIPQSSLFLNMFHVEQLSIQIFRNDYQNCHQLKQSKSKTYWICPGAKQMVKKR